MNLRTVLVLYAHEMRCALRERNIVAMSVILPLVMYPLLLWALFSALTFVEGQGERLDSRIRVESVPDAARSLVDSLAAQRRITVVEGVDGGDAQAAIAEGRLDALVRFVEAAGAGAPTVEVTYHEALDRSRAALRRIEEVVDGERNRQIEVLRVARGIGDAEWAGFLVVASDAASRQQQTRFLLSAIVPLLSLVMLILAAFYPAIDATAGERERSTIETLLAASAPRGSVALAKYLYVATFGVAGGLLNLTSLTLSLRWILRPGAGESAAALAAGGIPLSALPVIGIGMLLMALLVSALMLAFAAFARTFKEGQSMLGPVYLLLLLPASLLQSPDVGLTPQLALVPGANVVLLIREAITGALRPGPALIAAGSTAFFTLLALFLARAVLRNEDVVLTGGEGGLPAFLRRTLRRPSRRAPRTGVTP